LFVNINLNPVVIYRRNIDHKNSFIRLAFSPWRNYNISSLHVCTHTLNSMCSVVGTLTHILILHDLD